MEFSQMPPELEMAFLMRDASQAVKICVDQAVGKWGLTRPQWHILGVLLGEDGVPQKDLARRAQISAVALTGYLDRLEGSGWIERLDNPVDRRSKLVRIRPERFSDLQAMSTECVTLFQSLIQDLSAREFDTFLRAMRRIIAAADLTTTTTPLKP